MSKELTFAQQQEITKRLEGYRSNPSNSNKWRYDLFAYIEDLMSQDDETYEPQTAKAES